MAVIEQPKKYTSHGKSFDTKAEATRHDELFDAREKLEEAKRRFQKVLAESAVTADGINFEFGVFRDYYFIVKPYRQKPYLREVSYLCWSWEVREQRDHPEIVEIRDGDDAGSERPHRNRFVPIRELYANKANADKALHIEQLHWLEEQRQDIEKPGEPAALQI